MGRHLLVEIEVTDNAIAELRNDPEALAAEIRGALELADARWYQHGGEFFTGKVRVLTEEEPL